MNPEEGLAPFRNSEKSGMKISRQNYERAAGTVGAMIEEIAKLPVPEQTVQNWKVLMSAMRTVDDRIDSTADKAERDSLTEKIYCFLEGAPADFSNDPELENSMQQVRGLLLDLPEEQKKSFLRSLSIILNVTERLKSEEKPKEAVELTMLEGQVTARLFFPFLPEEFRQSENYQKLVQAVTRLGRAANSFDTFTDLPSDYKNQETKIKPSIMNRVLFLGAAISMGKPVLQRTGFSKKILKEFLKRTQETYGNYPNQTEL